jgi:hypothetical protein
MARELGRGATLTAEERAHNKRVKDAAARKRAAREAAAKMRRDKRPTRKPGDRPDLIKKRPSKPSGKDSTVSKPKVAARRRVREGAPARKTSPRSISRVGKKASAKAFKRGKTADQVARAESDRRQAEKIKNTREIIDRRTREARARAKRTREARARVKRANVQAAPRRGAGA